jgi:hypothetical protein
VKWQRFNFLILTLKLCMRRVFCLLSIAIMGSYRL